MGAKSRTKGAAGEREIVQMFREHLGIELERNLQQSINGGFDIKADLNPLTRSLAIEVKRHKTATQAELVRWWGQALDQAGHKFPVLFFRADRQDWRVMVQAEVLSHDLIGRCETIVIEPSMFFFMVREGYFKGGLIKIDSAYI